MPDTTTEPGPEYRIWSNTHERWWGPDAAGYTDDITEAGRFTEDDAIGHTLRMAQPGLLTAAVVMVRVREMLPV